MRGVLFLCIFQALFYVHAFTQSAIVVTDQNIRLKGRKTVDLYFGFARGDLVQVSFWVRKNKNADIEVRRYPSQVIFSTVGIPVFEKRSFLVPDEGIYVFRISNPSMFARICRIRIERIPAGEHTLYFPTTVVWKTIYDTIFNIRPTTVLKYDTIKLVHTQKVLIHTEWVEDIIYDRVLLVDTHAVIKFKIDATFSDKTRIIQTLGWAFWIGADEQSLQSWNENMKLLERLKSQVEKHLKFKTPLGAHLAGYLPDFIQSYPAETEMFWEEGHLPAERDDKNDFMSILPGLNAPHLQQQHAVPLFKPDKYKLHYVLFDDAYQVKNFLLNSQYLPIWQGNGYDEYAVMRQKLSGQFYLVIKNENLSPVEVNCRIVALKEVRHYAEKPVIDTILKPYNAIEYVKEPVQIIQQQKPFIDR